MKRRTIITSVLVIVLCLGLISGSTFALFTSESKVNIAVTSGKVQISATLSDPILYSADATLGQGTLVDKVNPLDEHPGEILPTDPQGAFAGTYYYHDRTTEGSFLNGGTAAIENGELKITKITPGDKVTTNITITNDSNVDIQYRVKVNVLSGLKLYEGLVVKVDGLSLKGVQKVSNWTYKAIPANETEKTIAIIPVEVYLPLDAGNEYQDLSTSMQITVEAVQGNAKTTNETLAQAINVEEPVDEEASTNGQVITDTDNLVTVTVPATAFTSNTIVVPTTEDTTTSLSVKIEPKDTISDIDLTSTQTSQSYDLEVLIKTQVGTADPTTVKYNKNNEPDATALKIKMFVGTGLTGVKLYHKTSELTAVASLAEVDALNEYYYDSTEGYITLMTNSFSEYTVVYNKDIAVETVDEQTQKSTITVYTPTEDANVYEDSEGNSVVISFNDENEATVVNHNEHVWNDGIITKVATSEVEGEITYTCTLCGAKKYDVVPKIQLPKITIEIDSSMTYDDFKSAMADHYVKNENELTISSVSFLVSESYANNRFALFGDTAGKHFLSSFLDEYNDETITVNNVVFNNCEFNFSGAATDAVQVARINNQGTKLESLSFVNCTFKNSAGKTCVEISTHKPDQTTRGGFAIYNFTGCEFTGRSGIDVGSSGNNNPAADKINVIGCAFEMVESNKGFCVRITNPNVLTYPETGKILTFKDNTIVSCGYVLAFHSSTNFSENDYTKIVSFEGTIQCEDMSKIWGNSFVGIYSDESNTNVTDAITYYVNAFSTAYPDFTKVSV